MSTVKTINVLCALVNERFSAWIDQAQVVLGELTVEVKPSHLHALCLALRDTPELACQVLVDVCGVDYLHYGLDEWETQSATETGFGRGVASQQKGGTTKQTKQTKQNSRFAVVYHLLSVTHNHRIRLRVFLPDESQLMVDSVMDVWSSADWFERETFDLFGILFRGHPDLRRILTDYGFSGHPFRKDFPLIGKVEARYDAASKRVVYEPVSIQPRILEPKVIRRDNRYLSSETVDGK